MTDAAEIRCFRDPRLALGVAAHWLTRRPPLRDLPAGEVVATLAGQIARGDYLMAFRGDLPAGYAGWVLLDVEGARRMATGSIPPPPMPPGKATVLWLLTVAAEDAATLRAMLAEGRRLHPGLVVMGIRHGAGRPSRLLRVRLGRA